MFVKLILAGGGHPALNKSPIVVASYFSRDSTDIRPYVKLTFDKFQTMALVDSGATITCIKSDIFENVKDKCLHYVPWEDPTGVQTISGDSLGVLGLAVLHVELAGRHFSHGFLVVQNITSNVVLGYDFLRDNYIGLENHELKLKGKFLVACAAMNSMESRRWKHETSSGIRDCTTVAERGSLENTPTEIREAVGEAVRIKAPTEHFDGLKDLLLQYADVFSKTKYDLGHSDVIQHDVRMTNDKIVHVKQFRIPLLHVQVVQKYVDELLEQGVIEPSQSEFNSPIFCVPKKALPEGQQDPTNLRVVQDFRKVNENSRDDPYVIREIKDCIDEIGLHGSKIFSTIDLTSGFWQQELRKEARKYTAFTVPGKNVKYQFARTAMGLKGASSSFAKLINYVIRDIEGVMGYIDDVMIHSSTWQEHVELLEKVLLRFRQYNLKINARKSTFGAQECEYLGFRIGEEGIRPIEEKCTAIKDTARPKTISEVRRFVGLCNYFRGLIPNFAIICEPLNALTRKETNWKAGEDIPGEAAKAIDTLKDLLCKAPVVRLPRPGCDYILTTDASTGTEESKGGLGAVLSQIDEEGKEFVIGYASRLLKAHEQNYSAYLLELAAASYGIDQFHVYLVGRKFELRMDHKPLEALSTVHKKTLNRLQLQMNEYDFKIRYRPGSENVVADYLSRSAVAGIEWSKDDGQWQEAQAKDERIMDLRRFLEEGFLPEHSKAYAATVERIGKTCFMRNGLVMRMLTRKGQKNRNVLLVPKGWTTKIIQEAHCGPLMGHAGIDKTTERILGYYWWHGVTNDVANFVKTCQRCQEISNKKAVPVPLSSLPITMAFGDRVHIDLFGPLKDPEGFNYIMVMTDSFTKYVELKALRKKDAECVAEGFFEGWICRHGCPVLLVSDKGKEFCNAILDELCKNFGIERSTTSPYHPQTNAQAEIFNKSMKRFLKASLDNDQTLLWRERLPALMISYNTQVHKSTLETPFFLTRFAEARLPYFDLDAKPVSLGESWAAEKWTQAQDTYRRARNNALEAERVRKAYYDRRSREHDYRLGDRVLLFKPTQDRKVNQKFFKTWSDIYFIIEVPDKHTVRVQKSPFAKTKTVNVQLIRHLNTNDLRQEVENSEKDTQAEAKNKVDIDLDNKVKDNSAPIASRTRARLK